MAKDNSQQLASNLRYLQEAGRLKLTDQEQESLNQGPDQMRLAQLNAIAERCALTLERLLTARMADVPQGLKFLIMDCDGVLTDGAMTFTKNGDELKSFNAKDGLGIKKLQERGWLTGIISAGVSTGLVEKRAQMLGVEQVYVGQKPKWEILEEWLQERHMAPEAVVYIGDDLSDLPILEKVGYSACPANAVKAVRNRVHQVLELEGGAGCVRELIDDYLLPSL